MNQATNRIPYNMLTEDEMAQFCLEAKSRGCYEFYDDAKWVPSQGGANFNFSLIYRLKILPEEWYYCSRKSGHDAIQGKNLSDICGFKTLRPATAKEMPEPEPIEPSGQELVGALVEMKRPIHNHVESVMEISEYNDDSGYYIPEFCCWHARGDFDLVSIDQLTKWLDKAKELAEVNAKQPTNDETPTPEEPEKGLKQRIEEKYPDYDVWMLEWMDFPNGHKYLRVKGTCSSAHSFLPSIKGFQGYVYEDEDGVLHRKLDLVFQPNPSLAVVHPVAVLFKKGSSND